MGVSAAAAANAAAVGEQNQQIPAEWSELILIQFSNFKAT